MWLDNAESTVNILFVLYRSNFFRSASRLMEKLEISVEVWCPLTGARARSQFLLRFLSPRGNVLFVIMHQCINGSCDMAYLIMHPFVSLPELRKIRLVRVILHIYNSGKNNDPTMKKKN